MRLATIVLCVILSAPALAADGWFVPNPRKLRLLYSGSDSQARQVKTSLRALAPKVKVLRDKRGGAFLFEANPQSIRLIQELHERGQLLIKKAL